MIFTSYFENIKNIPTGFGLKLISIARGTPHWFDGEKAPEFFPDWDIIKLVKNDKSRSARAKYVSEYEKILNKLNPKKLGRLYQNCVLLCYEKPDDFCHRHIISRWFNQNGIECKELLC